MPPPPSLRRGHYRVRGGDRFDTKNKMAVKDKIMCISRYMCMISLACARTTYIICVRVKRKGGNERGAAGRENNRCSTERRHWAITSVVRNLSRGIKKQNNWKDTEKPIPKQGNLTGY